jgi:hypothetical protein
MKKAQALNSFFQHVLPLVKTKCSEQGKVDQSIKKEAWLMFIDKLYQDGFLKKNQLVTWKMPV